MTKYKVTAFARLYSCACNDITYITNDIKIKKIKNYFV